MSSELDQVARLHGLPHLFNNSATIIPVIVGLRELRSSSAVLFLSRGMDADSLLAKLDALQVKILNEQWIKHCVLDPYSIGGSERAVRQVLPDLRHCCPHGLVWNYTTGTKQMMLGPYSALDVGEPDIDILPADDGQVRVKINGVDVFHPNTGEVRSDGAEGIACWFIDTDYNEESFFVRHAYFLGANDPYKSLKATLRTEINAEAWATLNSDTSRPFPKPAGGRIAVKVINHLGDEVMKVFKVERAHGEAGPEQEETDAGTARPNGGQHSDLHP